MAFDREAALAEGYTEDEINAYLQAEAAKKKETPVTADPGEPPAPTTKIQPVESSAASVATTGGMAVAPYVVPAAAGAAAAYGGGKVYGAWKAGTDAAQALAQSQAAQAAADRAAAQGLQQRFEQRMANQAGQAVRPVAPAGTPTYNVPTANTPQMRAPLPTAPVAPSAAPVAGPVAGPVAPAGMPAPAQSPGIMAQIRALAAQRILPAAGNLAKGSIGPGMALYSGGLNTGEEEELRRRRQMPPTITPGR